MPNTSVINNDTTELELREYLLKLAPHFSVFNIAEKRINDANNKALFKIETGGTVTHLDTNFNRAMFKIVKNSSSDNIGISFKQSDVVQSDVVFQKYDYDSDSFIVIAVNTDSNNGLNIYTSSNVYEIIGVGF